MANESYYQSTRKSIFFSKAHEKRDQGVGKWSIQQSITLNGHISINVPTIEAIEEALDAENTLSSGNAVQETPHLDGGSGLPSLQGVPQSENTIASWNSNDTLNNELASKETKELLVSSIQKVEEMDEKLSQLNGKENSLNPLKFELEPTRATIEEKMPQAVSIVNFNEGSNRAYTLNVKALEDILGNPVIANKKLALISVAGTFRKGKSFLLNFFIAYMDSLIKGQQGEWLNEKTSLDKFHYKCGTQRDTNGILMWDTPYQFKTPDGEEIAVFFMDTQGTFDHQSSVQDCTTIFALSTLLSSVQIFNVSSQIQEDDLNNLRLFTEYAKLARDQENQSQKLLQKLLFLIRDWPNSEEIAYGFKGGQKYLDDVMEVSQTQKKELQNVREELKASFESIEAFLMPHPGLTISENNSQKVLGDNQLLPKTINGEAISCGELLELFKAYMDIFNSNKLPEPQTILEATVKAVLVAAELNAKKEYDDYMEKKMIEHPNLAVLSESLDQLHREAEDRMLKKFGERLKLGDKDAIADVENALRQHYQARYVAYKKTVTDNLRREEEKKSQELKDQSDIYWTKAKYFGLGTAAAGATIVAATIAAAGGATIAAAGGATIAAAEGATIAAAEGASVVAAGASVVAAGASVAAAVVTKAMNILR